MLIGSRVRLATVVVLATAVVVCGLFLWGLVTLKTVRRHYVEAVDVARAGAELQVFTHSRLLADDAESARQWERRLATLRAGIARVAADDPVAGARLRQRLEALAGSIATSGLTADPAVHGRVHRQVLELVKAGFAVMDEHEIRYETVQRWLIWGGIGVAVGLALATCALLLCIERCVARPIAALRAGAERVAGGDLGHRIGLREDHEIGALARAFDQVAERLGRALASRQVLDREVAERRRIAHRLAEERAFLQAVIDGVPDPVMVIDAEQQVRLLNRAARRGPAGRMLATSGCCYAVVHELKEPCDERTRTECPMREVMRSAERATFERQVTDRRGSERVVEVEVAPLRGADGRVWGVIETARDISEQRRAEHELRFLAHHDPLTRLPNRILFFDRLEHALERVRRGGGRLALLYVDLDGFKEINDRDGHDAGDAVLVEVARRLEGALREADTVARLGGDEFTVLLEGVAGRETAREVADKLCRALEVPITVAGVERRVGASIGIALYPDDGERPERLLSAADRAMYAAKREGG